ncbi:hypothetical protein Cfor_02693 [Coptotermes formosanus]|uniref:DDE-1 domain-containing protein n=1 Tax=Coptotermes formosanus TaxID=36987 RepID=A0A6L2PIS0_COPFO|nr:hypothetical protein Cfor_02693 [Coptotermes formosanus]
MVCTNAARQAVPPFVIMKGVRNRDAYSKGMPNGSVVHMSECGYMTSQVFSAFLNHIYKYKPQGRVLLIVDGHSSHCKDPDVLDKVSRLGVEILCLPPHSTHKCQPLDVSYFKSLKQFYNEACRNFIRQHPGRRFTKEDFCKLLKLLWYKSPTAGNLSGGFLKCGIHPYNPDILAEDIFEYQPAPAVNGGDGVRLAEDTADSRTSTSTLTSFEELPPLPKITFPSDPFIRKGRKKQDSAVVTSADFRETQEK